LMPRPVGRAMRAPSSSRRGRRGCRSWHRFSSNSSTSGASGGCSIPGKAALLLPAAPGAHSARLGLAGFDANVRTAPSPVAGRVAEGRFSFLVIPFPRPDLGPYRASEASVRCSIRRSALIPGPRAGPEFPAQFCGLGRRLGVGDEPQRRGRSAGRWHASGCGFRCAVEACHRPQPNREPQWARATRLDFAPGVAGPQFGAADEPRPAGPQADPPAGAGAELALHHRGEMVHFCGSLSPTSCGTGWCPARKTRPRSFAQQTTIITFIGTSLGGSPTAAAASGVGLGIAMAGAGAFDRPGFHLALALTCRGNVR